MNTESPSAETPPAAAVSAPEAPVAPPVLAGATAGESAAGTARAHQHAFLLDQLLQATPDHKLPRGVANKKIGAAAKKHLGLDAATANRVRDELAAQGLIRSTKKGQVVTDELTDEGRHRLQTLERPSFPTRQRPVRAISEHVLRFVKPYLLLQLLRADGHCLTLGEANRFNAVGKQFLTLTPGNARAIRLEMRAAGLIDIEPDGRTERYRLTDAGLVFLATHEQYPAGDITLKGSEFNELLRAARPAVPAYSPRPTNLSDALLAEFEELRLEHHGHTGRVPIYQLRERFAAKYGPDAARHDALDDAILQLWRERRVRLVSLSDLQKATLEQLNASVPGMGETLFYMERPHE